MKKITPEWYGDVTQVTPKDKTRKGEGKGYKFTSIDAHYLLMLANEHLGLYGHRWGIKNMNYSVLKDAAKRPELHCLDAVFFYTLDINEGGFVVEFPISVDMPYYTTKAPVKVYDDHRKKLQTSATVKGLSKIGFSADIFMGMYDDLDYTPPETSSEPMIKTVLPPILAKQMRDLINKTTDLKQLNATEKKLYTYKDTASSLELKELINEKKKLL